MLWLFCYSSILVLWWWLATEQEVLRNYLVSLWAWCSSWRCSTWCWDWACTEELRTAKIWASFATYLMLCGIYCTGCILYRYNWKPLKRTHLFMRVIVYQCVYSHIHMKCFGEGWCSSNKFSHLRWAQSRGQVWKSRGFVVKPCCGVYIYIYI